MLKMIECYVWVDKKTGEINITHTIDGQNLYTAFVDEQEAKRECAKTNRRKYTKGKYKVKKMRLVEAEK